MKKTLWEFMNELNFHRFTRLELAMARIHKMDTKNNPDLKRIYEMYQNGLYAGDLDVLVKRVIEFAIFNK